MFGFLNANLKELTDAQQDRYQAVYCGICRQIRSHASQTARLGLSYDMTFLALLLMSLYEPEEVQGSKACALHPLKPRPWVVSEYTDYAADMNIALAYYKAQDDIADDHRLTAQAMARIFGKHLPEIEKRYPRQCNAIDACIRELTAMEKAGCANPDEPAGCFGRLMGELLTYREDLWSPRLRQMGDALGRFIYLADAAVDYRRDSKRGKYNPFLAMGTGEDWSRWEEYLVLAMGRCSEAFEMLPLVQDKALLNNILYSGIWLECNRAKPRSRNTQEESS